MATKAKSASENVPAPIDWTQDAGAGFENVRQDDLGIPFLSIIQKMSPEVDEDSPKYIPGIKVGDIVLSTTKQSYAGKDRPVEFIPCGYQKAYVEWAPRENGGGYIATHGPGIMTQTTKNEKGQDVLENGNIIVTTAYVVGYINADGEWLPAVLSMSSTQLKKARQWLNIMTSQKFTNREGKKLQLPMYSHKYLLSTQPESNEFGTWYGWKIEVGSMVNELPLVEKAREQHQQIATGSMRALQPPTGSDLPF